MKTYVFLSLFLALNIGTSAQTRKFTVAAEYSASFSNMTAPFFDNTEGYLPSQNIFIKGGYRLVNNIQLTLGAGFLNTRELERHDFFEDIIDIETIKSYNSYNYAVFPIGLRYYLGSFYINPEIGYGILKGLPTRQITFSTNTITEIRFKRIAEIWGFEKTSVPIFLGLGYEIDMKGYKILLGAKGYYSLTVMRKSQFLPIHYYGFGIVTGIKF